jgi:nucleotide-binding universal stress UspA family protein
VRPIETVVVGFDGSTDAEVAVRWALSLARQVDIDVILVHAVGLLEPTRHPEVAVELESAMQRLILECDVAPSRVRLDIVDGDACSVLLRCAEEPLRANLLVVGSRGIGAHAGLLLGSTSLELAEHSTIPVVVVPTLIAAIS